MNSAEEQVILRSLQKLPNIGPACARDLLLLGYHSPESLAGQEPREMYERLCALTEKRHDPCVLDTFMSAVSFANGNPAQPWWHFTPERKRLMSEQP